MPENRQNTPETITPARAAKPGKYGSIARAARFLGPYRKYVVVSIIAAFFVGAFTTTGLTALLPVMRVLIDEESVPHYIDRVIVEKRLGATLDSDTKTGLHVLRLGKGAPARQLGIKPGDTLPGGPEALPALAAGGSLPAGTLPATPWWAEIARNTAAMLPINPVGALAVLLGAVAVLAVCSNIIRYFQEHYADCAAIFAVNDMRVKTYDHLLHLPLGYFGQYGTSDVTSRLMGDAAGLQDCLKILLGQCIQEPIKAAMALGLAMIIDWRLTLIIIFCAPLMAYVVKKLGKKVRRSMRTALQKNASLLGQLESTLSGIRVVKGARAERWERRRYSHLMDGLVVEQLRMSRYEALTTPTMETIALVVVSGVVLAAAYLVLIQRTLEATDFFLILACLVAIGESLRRVSKLNNVLQRGNAAATRIFEVLDMPVERPRMLTTKNSEPRKPLVNLPVISHEISFENIRFAYAGTDALALDGVSLKIPKGKTTAIVGRNGSGKTTLLALLPRFYEPLSGSICIDGIDLASVTLPSLRKQISIVTQESIIFPGTIAQNIAYGHPLAERLDAAGEKDWGEADSVNHLRQQVEAAAKRAFAHDFILQKPLGYDTPLDGLGGQLSGGQRQRLCIARAILRGAPILILDEATSQVDAESEHLIQQAVDELLQHGDAEGHRPTTFVIAHRFSTILNADEIIVMDNGRIVGTGTHRELLASSETYQKLYERQLVAMPG